MDAASLVLVRFFTYASIMLAFGGAAFRGYAPIPDDDARSQRIMAGLLVIALAASAVGLAVVVAAMSGVAVVAINPGLLATVIGDTALGIAWLVRMAALAVALLMATRGRAPAQPVALAAVLAIALGSLAWGGHAVAGEGATGWFVLAADIVHLLAAGLWIGALGAFTRLLWSGRRSDPAFAAVTWRSLARFAPIGTGAVLALVATGLVNGAALVGWAQLPSLGSTLYGRVLIAKLALFAAMLTLAALNRFRFTPAMAGNAGEGADQGWRTMRRSVTLETLAAVVVVALVAWLGTLSPPLASG